MSQTIKLTRGDTLRLKFQRHDFNCGIITDEPHAIFFTVKRSFADDEFVFQITKDAMTYEEDTKDWHFVILPETTESLEYGEYVFDLEIIQNEEKTEAGKYKNKTTVQKGTLVIENESTWAVNEGGNNE